MPLLYHTLERSGMVAVTGGRIHYRLYVPHCPDNAQKPPLIVVHGGPGDSHTGLYSCLHSLANDRPVLFYDQLGSYYSPTSSITPDLMTIERFSEEISFLAAHLNFTKFSLLGHSWGAAICTQFAYTNPHQVIALIFSGAFLSTKIWINDCKSLLEKLPKSLQDTIKTCEETETIDSVDYKNANIAFSKEYFLRNTPWPPYYIHGGKQNAALYNMMWGPSEFTCSGLLKDMDLTPLLEKIMFPTLFICGEYDTARPTTAQNFANKMQRATVQTIPNSGHVSYADNNEAYISAVRNFLDQAVI